MNWTWRVNWTRRYKIVLTATKMKIMVWTIFFFIIQHVKACVIPCPQQPLTRSYNTVSVAQGGYQNRVWTIHRIWFSCFHIESLAISVISEKYVREKWDVTYFYWKVLTGLLHSKWLQLKGNWQPNVSETTFQKKKRIENRN